MASTLVRMEAPVVVKPLTVSKKASTQNGISPLNRKGSIPMRDISTQASATMTKPSRAKKVWLVGLLSRVMARPITRAMAADASRSQAQDSPYQSATAMGSSNRPASKVMMRPTV